MEYKKIICPYDCPAACALLAGIDKGKLIKVKGDPDHPFFHGAMCQKMRGFDKAVNSEKRLLYPLKRVGEKGLGQFERISWQQAMKEITDKWKEILNQNTPDAFVTVSSSGTQGRIQKQIVDAFSNKIGARRMQMTLCCSALAAAAESMTGGVGYLCPSEMVDSDYYVIWGSNLKATRIHTLEMIIKERKKGKKAVLVESCAVDNAAYFDQVILVKPGTDGALALSMMHVMAKEGLIDDAFLESFASGYQEFEKTLYQYTPEWASAITGVPANRIEEFAREFGHAHAPALLQGSGLSRQANGGMNSRILILLSAITGGWRYPGGGYAGPGPRSGSCIKNELIARPDLRTFFGKAENINLLSKVLSDTSVKAFYLSGGNPVNSVHDQKQMIKALSREDLFTVVHEQVMTDTAKYADYVLPATFSVEHTDCYNANGYCTFATSYKAIEAPAECKSNWETICALADAMGYEDDIFHMTAEDMLKKLLDNPGDMLKELPEEKMQILREGGTVAVRYSDKMHFHTPDGKMRIIDDRLEDPIPCYKELPSDGYPLSLISVPGVYTLNTVFEIRDDLVEKRGAMQLIIHPDDAKARNIKDGDRVLVFNDLAELAFVAKISNLVARGCVAAPSVYSSSSAGQRLQVNALHHARLSDIGCATTMNGNSVDCRRI